MIYANILLIQTIEPLRDKFVNDALAIIAAQRDEREVMSTVATKMRDAGWKFGPVADLEYKLESVGFSINRERNYRGQLARFVRLAEPVIENPLG